MAAKSLLDRFLDRPGGIAALLHEGRRRWRQRGSSVSHLGGLELISMLANTAYRNWRDDRGAPIDLVGGDEPAISRKLLAAMISAAKSDGNIDQDEQEHIFTEADLLDLDEDSRSSILDELRVPPDPRRIASSAASQEEAVVLYAASLLVIDPDNAAERDYLARLAAELGLDPGLVRHLHRTVDGAMKPSDTTH